MNRKGENSFNLNEEKQKYDVGMEVFLKKKKGKIIYLNDHYITVEYTDGIKESFVWHELFEKNNNGNVFEDEEEIEDPEMDVEDEEEIDEEEDK